MRLLILALGISLAVVLPGPVKAQIPRLDPTQIEGFLAALPELRALGEPGGADIGTDPATPFASLLTYIALYGGLDQAVAITAKHGFESLGAWAAVGNRTMRAYAYLNANAGLGDAAEQIAASVAKIRGDAELTSEQQDIMLRQLELATGTILRFQPPPQDIAAIDPYMVQLDRLFQ